MSLPFFLRHHFQYRFNIDCWLLLASNTNKNGYNRTPWLLEFLRRNCPFLSSKQVFVPVECGTWGCHLPCLFNHRCKKLTSHSLVVEVNSHAFWDHPPSIVCSTLYTHRERGDRVYLFLLYLCFTAPPTSIVKPKLRHKSNKNFKKTMTEHSAKHRTLWNKGTCETEWP